MMHVLLHIDESEKWPMLLANVENFLDAEEDAKLVVVANGPAVRFYTERGKIDPLLRQRVDFVFCNNAMRGQEITAEDLDTNIRVVPAGVVEIARLQLEGYAYIKP